MTQRAHDELELPDFDLDDNLGEDYFGPVDDLEGDLSMTSSRKTDEFGMDYVPTIGMKTTRISGPRDSSRVKWCRVPIMSP